MRGVSCNPYLADYPCYSPSQNLEDSIENLLSDATVSRQFSEADDVLSAWLAAGNDPDVIVIHLGTNGPPTSSQFADVMAVAEPDDRVLFLTAKVDRWWESDTNNVLQSNVDKYSNAELVDWYTVATAKLDMASIDPTYGAHLWTSSARDIYIDLIADSIANP